MPYSVSLRCETCEADILLAEFVDFDTTGIEHTEQSGDTCFTAHFENRREAEQFATRFAPGAVIAEIEARNWAEEWQSLWQPIEVGRGFYLCPPWINDAVPRGRIRLEMRPGLVFGGGDHATTQLCLELLEDYLQPGDAMADIGCGSGILTDGAHGLGAGFLVASDIEFDAAAATRHVLQGLGRPTAVYRGSADALRAACVDIVAANLLTGVVAGLLPQFARILKPGGLLIASGFLANQQDLISVRAEQQGFRVRERRTKTDWAAGVYERLPPDSI